MLRIEKIYVWMDSRRYTSLDSLGHVESWAVAQAYYSNGNIVKWNDHFGSFPKTVQRFLDEHDPIRLNSSCCVYADDVFLSDFERRRAKYYGC